MESEEFFREQREQSEIKALIVAKYFDAWSRVMLTVKRQNRNIDRLAYVDLFAGPGRYNDGKISTPVLVLEKAIANPELRECLVTVFNDRDTVNVASLKRTIEELPGIGELRHPPLVYCSEVDKDVEAIFRRMSICPTFSFADPWGYKGLSLGFIQAMIKDWGCDSLFFFNYSRVNASLSNDKVRDHMDALFGRERVETMRRTMSEMEPNEREPFILEGLASALHDMGAKYVLPFRFRRPDGSRTSHALIFVSKHIKGHNIMKDIMAGMSSSAEDDVSSFEYSLADERCPRLFSLKKPLADLPDTLATRYAGRTMTVQEIYEAHNPGTPFVLKNYQSVLREMEQSGRVTADPPAAMRRRTSSGEKSMAKNVRITFPSCAPAHG